VVVLSCDGVGDAHDRARPFKGGRGSFARVDRAARELAAAGVPLCLTPVVWEHNVDALPELVHYVAGLRRQYNAPAFLSLEPMIGPPPSSDLARRIQAAFLNAASLCREAGVPVSGKPFHAFESLVRPGGATGHFCGVTGTELSVTADGQLRLCHAIPNSDYGDLATASATNRIPLPLFAEQRSGGRLAACDGCEVEGLCGGGCMAQSLRIAGAPNERPGNLFCDLMTSVFRQSVKEVLTG
jgi:uncharacterized protein